MWPEGLHVHMIGIGGAGMSSMARYLRDAGAFVTGSDRQASPLFLALQREGIDVTLGEGGSLPGDGLDLAVCTAAATEGNPGVAACRREGIPVLKYSAMLGRIMERHRGIAVAGTHGKTSVSAMIAFLLDRCGLSPSFVIGGVVSCLGGVGGGCGRGEHLVVEACEFSRSFLDLRPSISVVTNVEEDHLDYYRDLDDLRGAFADFLSRRQEGGDLIVWDGIPDPETLTADEIMTYGFGDYSFLRISDVVPDRKGSTFSLFLRGDPLGEFRINQPGRHSVLNGAASILAALRAGCTIESLRDVIPLFAGVARRMERRGRFGQVTLYSDYAHHPSEIAAVSEALRTAHPGERIVTVYQAHQRSRTAYFFDGLAEALARFDLSLVVDTFSVREENVDHLPDGRALAERIKQESAQSSFIGSLSGAAEKTVARLEAGDVLVLMGAGDIDEITRPLEEKLSLL